jgi:hypothetical protein
MSHLIYSDTEPRPTNVPLGRLNPTRQYIKHLENWFFLKLVLMNDESMINRHQASKELAICDRKLAYWAKKAGFDEAEASRALQELKSKWQIDASPDITPK